MKKFDEEKRFKLICAIIMTILAIIAIAPFVLMISASITEENTLIAEGYRFFPKKISFDAYKYLWRNGKPLAEPMPFLSSLPLWERLPM